jgi:YD repeat-containing protein
MCEYRYRDRHWHAGSEKYTGADRLVSVLLNGGDVTRITFEEHWLHGSRRVMVYHFELQYDGQTTNMAVVSNPYLERLILGFALKMLPINRRLSTASSCGAR